MLRIKIELFILCLVVALARCQSVDERLGRLETQVLANSISQTDLEKVVSELRSEKENDKKRMDALESLNKEFSSELRSARDLIQSLSRRVEELEKLTPSQSTTTATTMTTSTATKPTGTPVPVGVDFTIDNPHHGFLDSIITFNNDQYLLSIAMDGEMKVWDMHDQGKLVSSFELDGETWGAVAVTTDHKILVGQSRQNLNVYDFKDSFKKLETFSFDAFINTLVLSGDDIVIMGGMNQILAYNMKSNSTLYTIKPVFDGNPDVDHLLVSSTQKLVGSSRYSQLVKIWNVNDGSYIRLLTHNGVVRAMTFNKANGNLITGSDDKTVRIWDIESGKLIRSFSGYSGGISAILVGNYDGLMYTFEMLPYTEYKVLQMETGIMIKVGDLTELSMSVDNAIMTQGDLIVISRDMPSKIIVKNAARFAYG